MTDTSMEKTGTTVFGLSTVDRIGVVVGFGLLAAAVGAAVPFLARWALRLRWTPLQGPLELIDSMGRVSAVAVLAVVGLVLGGAFGAVALREQVEVTVSDNDIRLDKQDTTSTIRRTDVSAVFLDGKRLVVLDSESKQSIRTAVEATDQEIQDGMRRHGYRWFDADPHADLFRRWAPGTPELPAAANALLTVRAGALAKKSHDDVDQFAGELQRLGYVVREQKKNQYWRPLVGL